MFFYPLLILSFFLLSKTILSSNFIHIISLNLSFHVVCEFDLGIQLLKLFVRNVTYFFPIQNFWFRNNEDLVASNLHLFILPFGRIVFAKKYITLEFQIQFWHIFWYNNILGKYCKCKMILIVFKVSSLTRQKLPTISSLVMFRR